MQEKITLSAFATLHAINQQKALLLWKAGFIAGRKEGKQIILAQQGKRDFWIQCHILAGFRTCDQCPHTIEFQSQSRREGRIL